MYISFDKNDQSLVRKLARERYGGKKGAITDVLRDAVYLMVQKEKDEAEREKSIKRMLAHMEKGLIDLKGKKAYERREDLYDRKIFPD